MHICVFFSTFCTHRDYISVHFPMLVCSLMVEKPSKGSGCREDNLGECAELGWMFCRKEKCGDPQAGTHILSTYYTPAHTHTHTLQLPNCHLYFCLCQAFPWPKKHTHVEHTQRKQPVRLPNRLMCHAFLSDISAKAGEGVCSTSLLLPLLLLSQ